MSLLPALIGAISPVVGGFVNQYFQREQMDYQHYLNQQDWQMQADYNSPASQMERFRQAGLNPDLIYGQMANGSPSMSPTSQSSTSIPDISQSIAAMSQLEQQQRLTDAEINLKESEAKKNYSSISMDEYELQFRKNWDDIQKMHEITLLRHQGLNAAIDAWQRGYKPPEPFVDEDGNKSYDDSYFQREYESMKDVLDAGIRSIKDEYELSSYDVKYLRKCFDAMVSNDLEEYNYRLNYLRSHSAVLKTMADNEWMQFADYLLDKFISTARSAGSVYQSFRAKK